MPVTTRSTPPSTRSLQQWSARALLAAAVALTSPLWLAPALADTASDGLPLWELGVFAGAVSTPAYPASIERSGLGLVLPVLVYRGEVFRAERGSVGARLVHTEDTEFDIGFAASLPASSNDIAARQGMPDLGTLVEFGPRLKTVLARPDARSQVRLELPLRSVIEVQGGLRTQGFAAEPELIWETRAPASAWRFATSASLIFGDARLNRYFYGVPADLATAQRPAYDAQSGLIATRLSASASRALTPDVRIFGFVRAENYAGNANTGSPLHLRSTGTSAGIGLNWTLRRSEARAR
ncbi:MipA/OmpV family protein [Rhodoferax sp.]|uniref:MipA/OmpV family protein n=1 Tax=Rhodoferax sp. TaxID=50421 RepID=UPI0025EC716E|nr:MipA/OmpV family protein [Rhodoferax sp.]